MLRLLTIHVLTHFRIVSIAFIQGPIFDQDAQSLVFAFFKQGMLKQILTEGEKYVMSLTNVLTFREQATFDIVNNLGSLAARFIFRPIEDNSYFYFTQTIERNVDFKEQEKVMKRQFNGM